MCIYNNEKTFKCICILNVYMHMYFNICVATKSWISEVIRSD